MSPSGAVIALGIAAMLAPVEVKAFSCFYCDDDSTLERCEQSLHVGSCKSYESVACVSGIREGRVVKGCSETTDVTAMCEHRNYTNCDLKVCTESRCNGDHRQMAATAPPTVHGTAVTKSKVHFLWCSICEWTAGMDRCEKEQYSTSCSLWSSVACLAGIVDGQARKTCSPTTDAAGLCQAFYPHTKSCEFKTCSRDNCTVDYQRIPASPKASPNDTTVIKYKYEALTCYFCDSHQNTTMAECEQKQFIEQCHPYDNAACYAGFANGKPVKRCSSTTDAKRLCGRFLEDTQSCDVKLCTGNNCNGSHGQMTP